VQERDVINGIWYVMWTGCQWKAVKREWFNVSSSTLHERFQAWTKAGIFDKLFKMIVRFYAREQHIGWKWQSADSKMVPALPKEHPFEIRYARVEKVDWESCAMVLSGEEKRRVLGKGW
jgi:transposase